MKDKGKRSGVFEWKKRSIGIGEKRGEGGMRSEQSAYILNNTKLTHLQVDVMNNQANNHLNNQVWN